MLPPDSSVPDPSHPAPVRLVVAGVLERDGKILIGQRKRTSAHPLKWEFPGGKVEPGEDPRDAVRREFAEELGIAVEVGEEIDAYHVRYGEGPVTHLRFFRIDRFHGEPRNLDFEQIVWEQVARFADYDFLEGDLRFIDLLRRTATASGPKASQAGSSQTS